MKYLRAPFFSLALILSGCGALPSQVDLPKHLDAALDNTGKPTAVDAKAQFDKYQGDMGIQPMATSRKALIYQMNVLIGEWNQQARDLLLERDLVDNFNFWGVLTGAGLVIAEEVDAAKTAAALVAGVNLTAENYKIVIQAANYVAAADAIECIRTQVYEVDETAWEKFFSDKGSLINIPPTDEQRIALQGVYPQLNSALSSVYKKLRTNQRSLRITAPTADTISKVIADTQKQMGAVNSLADQAKPNGVYNINSLYVKNEAELALLKQILAVGGKAQTCATAMGS
jgi:hypothetical protein